MNLRIGLLTKEINNLSNWQLRIIQEILDSPAYDLTLVIQQTKNQKVSNKSLFTQLLSKFRPARILLTFQQLLEKKIFFRPVFSIDRAALELSVQDVPKIELEERIPISIDGSSSGVAEKVQGYDLGVIINLGVEYFSSDLIEVSKNGIWDFLYGDLLAERRKPNGFLEVVQKKPSIGFTLIEHTSDRNAVIVDQAFFNRGWSMVETATIAKEGGVSVLFKNLKRLGKGNRLDPKPHAISKREYPGTFEILKYMAQFNGHLLGKIKQKFAYRLLGRRHECWSVFVGKGNFLEHSLSGIKPFEMPRNEFWADPFLFRHQSTDYLFFENYSYRNNRGKISCGKVVNEELIEVTDVLDLDYHLSFPFIFKEKGNIYMMPETSENNRLEIYRAVEFPAKWELFTTAFEGERVADAFFFDDENDEKWLFVNKQVANTSPMNSELFIYKTDSIRLDNLQPHLCNPVLIDARVARNGGAIFSYKDEFYRPSQRNTDGVYGRALNINKIKKLTLTEYEEENIRIYEADFDKNLMATHHLHQTDNLFVIDAAYWAK